MISFDDKVARKREDSLMNELELEVLDSKLRATSAYEEKSAFRKICKPSCVPICLIMIMIALVVVFPLVNEVQSIFNNHGNSLAASTECLDQCIFTVVESIPENLTYKDTNVTYPSVFSGWMNLLSLAESEIDIASSYWTMRGSDVFEDPSAWQGEKIFSELMKAGTERGIKIRIAQNQPSYMNPDKDTKELQRAGAAEVRSLNFKELVGNGILHTKMWLVDRKHFYVGSANLDWRSLTQVKELGAIIYNCSCLAEDMKKIFEVYWYLGKPNEIPIKWPSEYNTPYNMTNPLKLKFNDSASQVYLASSPPPFCPEDRSTDIDAIIGIINSAKKYVFVAVMDYFPTTLYERHRHFWPKIDDALRRVSLENGVEVRLLVSWWNHTRSDMHLYLKSLESINGALKAKIQVKLFKVPIYSPTQAKIPFARVNHNKYMVTDTTVFIGTSNWSADYFISTGGIGLVVKPDTANEFFNVHPNTGEIHQQMLAIFERDWNSEYAHSLEDYTCFVNRHTCS